MITWTKSSLSFANGNCVEVADLPNGQIGIRNSRNPEVVLQFSQGEWDSFMDGVLKGEFDVFGCDEHPSTG